MLRDPDTGEAIRLAPNYDNNIAMFARLSGTASVSASKDMLITDFIDLLEQKNIAFEVPKLSKAELAEIVEKIPVKDATGMAAEFVFCRQNMIVEALEKVRVQDVEKEAIPANSIEETEKRIHDLSQKMRSTPSVREKLELSKQIQTEQKKLESLKRHTWQQESDITGRKHTPKGKDL